MNRLSIRQRQTLQVMQKLRDDPPTLAVMVVSNWWRYLILLGYFTLVGTGIGLGTYFGLTYLIPVGCAFGGVLLGVLLSHIGQLNASAHTWPVMREVVDWQKVQQLLDEDASGEEAPDRQRW